MTAIEGGVAGLARSAASRPFWDGLAAGELRLPYCERCEQVFFYPRVCCPRCWSEEISWRAADGVGTVYAVTTVHIAFDPSLEVPYSVALVDLDAGIRLAARVASDGAEVAVGDRVALAFTEDPAEAVPCFVPVPNG